MHDYARWKPLILMLLLAVMAAPASPQASEAVSGLALVEEAIANDFGSTQPEYLAELIDTAVKTRDVSLRGQVVDALTRYYKGKPGLLQQVSFDQVRRLSVAEALWGSDSGSESKVLALWVESDANLQSLPPRDLIWAAKQLEYSDERGGAALPRLRSRLGEELGRVDPTRADAQFLEDLIGVAAPSLDENERQTLLERTASSFFDESSLPEVVSLRDPIYYNRLRAWRGIHKHLRTDGASDATYVRATLSVINRLPAYELYWEDSYGDYEFIAGSVDSDEAIDELRKHLVLPDGGPNQRVANVLSYVNGNRGADHLERWGKELQGTAYEAGQDGDGDLYARWLMAQSFAQGVEIPGGASPARSLLALRQGLEAVESAQVRGEIVRRIALIHASYHRFDDAMAVIEKHRSVEGETGDAVAFFAETEQIVLQIQRMVADEKARFEDVACCGDE